MTDILKRLREQVELGTALEAEAADEIERLRWQRDEQDKGILASSALLAGNAIEIERLRAANAELARCIADMTSSYNEVTKG